MQLEETLLCIREQSLSRGASQSAVRRLLTERADMLHHDNAPAHSTALMQAFFGKASHHPGLSDPYSPDLVPCDF